MYSNDLHFFYLVLLDNQKGCELVSAQSRVQKYHVCNQIGRFSSLAGCWCWLVQLSLLLVWHSINTQIKESAETQTSRCRNPTMIRKNVFFSTKLRSEARRFEPNNTRGGKGALIKENENLHSNLNHRRVFPDCLVKGPAQLAVGAMSLIFSEVLIHEGHTTHQNNYYYKYQ